MTELRIELAPLTAGGEYARSNTGTLGTPGNTSGLFTVYNFQVEDYHTYYAAPQADKPFVWVHNADYDLRLKHRQASAAKALAPLKKEFPDADVGFRGSLARGKKGPHKRNAPFNPDDFDVDAFVVSDELAAMIPPNRKGIRKLNRLEDYEALTDELRASLNKIPGHRREGFFVRVFTRAEFESKVGSDERYFVTLPGG